MAINKSLTTLSGNATEQACSLKDTTGGMIVMEERKPTGVGHNLTMMGIVLVGKQVKKIMNVTKNCVKPTFDYFLCL